MSYSVSMAVSQAGRDDCVKFGYSTSNRCGNIRADHFRIDERMSPPLIQPSRPAASVPWFAKRLDDYPNDRSDLRLESVLQLLLPVCFRLSRLQLMFSYCSLFLGRPILHKRVGSRASQVAPLVRIVVQTLGKPRRKGEEAKLAEETRRALRGIEVSCAVVINVTMVHWLMF